MLGTCEVCPLNKVDIPDRLVAAGFFILDINDGRAGEISRAMQNKPAPTDDLPKDKLAKLTSARPEIRAKTNAIVTCWLLRHTGECPTSPTHEYRDTDFPPSTI